MVDFVIAAVPVVLVVSIAVIATSNWLKDRRFQKSIKLFSKNNVDNYRQKPTFKSEEQELKNIKHNVNRTERIGNMFKTKYSQGWAFLIASAFLTFAAIAFEQVRNENNFFIVVAASVAFGLLAVFCFVAGMSKF